MRDPYQGISCNLYDQLEAYATQKVQLQIKFSEEDHQSSTILCKIINLETKDKAEYLITDTAQKIRLDKIISIAPMEE